MSDPTTEKRLPWYDFVLLPFLSLFTVLVLYGSIEAIACAIMPEALGDSCTVSDPVIGERAVPNCVSRSKTPEGQWVENRYNECGYRSDTPCHAALNGASRIAVIGSSTGWGLGVPTDETWYTRTADALSKSCHTRVDVQNLGGIRKFNQTAAMIPAALAEHPSVIVIFVAPFDLYEEQPGDFSPVAPGNTVSATAVKPKFGLITTIKSDIMGSRAVTLTEHMVFLQPASYIPLYLKNGDKAGFLRQPFAPIWQHRIDYADAALGYMAAQIHAAGVAFVLVYVPQEAQADLVSTGATFPDIDPYALEMAMRQIAARHGIIYADMMSRFRQINDPSDYFMAVDGHLNGNGQGLAALAVEAALTAKGGPFADCRPNGGVQQ